MRPRTALCKKVLLNWVISNLHNSSNKLTELVCTGRMAQVRELETELEAEQHRHLDSQKSQRKQDRRLQELILQLDEGQKSQDRLKDALDKLQQKNKQYKRQVEEAVSRHHSSFSHSDILLADPSYRSMQCDRLLLL